MDNWRERQYQLRPNIRSYFCPTISRFHWVVHWKRLRICEWWIEQQRLQDCRRRSYTTKPSTTGTSQSSTTTAASSVSRTLTSSSPSKSLSTFVLHLPPPPARTLEQ